MNHSSKCFSLNTNNNSSLSMNNISEGGMTLMEEFLADNDWQLNIKCTYDLAVILLVESVKIFLSDNDWQKYQMYV